MNRLSSSVILAATLCMGSCGTVNTVSTRTKPSDASISTTHKQINDLLTEIFLHAKDVRLAPTPGGPLQAQIDVANDGFHYRNFAYKFQWYDSQGMQISSQMSPWKPASVPAGGSITLSSVAPSSAATDFSLQIRRSD